MSLSLHSISLSLSLSLFLYLSPSKWCIICFSPSMSLSLHSISLSLCLSLFLYLSPSKWCSLCLCRSVSLFLALCRSFSLSLAIHMVQSTAIRMFSLNLTPIEHCQHWTNIRTVSKPRANAPMRVDFSKNFLLAKQSPCNLHVFFSCHIFCFLQKLLLLYHKSCFCKPYSLSPQPSTLNHQQAFDAIFDETKENPGLIKVIVDCM